jgi:Mg2+-importing ATPase
MEVKIMKKNKKIVRNNLSNGVSPVVNRLIQYSLMNTDSLFSELHTKRTGLTSEEIENRQEKYGLNEVSHEKPDSFLKRLYKAFVNPFTVVLFILAVISFILNYELAAPEEKDLKTVIVISIMVIISGLLRFIQETRSSDAAEKLKAMVRTTAMVRREDTGKIELPLAQIVPGDIIYLASGDMIPADVRIIFSKDLFISQSALTGESEPIEKYDSLLTHTQDNMPQSPLELENLCFMGSNVISGTAVAVVLVTGDQTYFGSMAKSITGQRAQTSFDKGVNSVSWVLIRFMMCMVPVVFIVNGLTKENWLEALLFALSVAVGLTPEMLPMIVTTNLAKGAVTMAKRKTVVKHLNSIQNFGAMDVLCTDKTGTLTQDKIILERHLDIHGNEDGRVLRHAFMNSYFQTGLKNLMDVAILEHANEAGFSEIIDRYFKVDEIPFDFSRRRMSVVLKDTDGKTQMVTKGAVEEMLAVSPFAEYKGEVVLLTDSIRQEIMDMVTKLNKDGMRVIAVAQKTNPSVEGVFSVKDESDMVLMGYIGFLDPPKKTSAAAIRALKDYGVTVKVLTGDNEIITKQVCKQVKLSVDNILLGSQVDTLSDEELVRVAETTNVFAKLSPQQKARIVRALKQGGHTVGFMGDGINDAAAMLESDVGISVDTAVDIAKESADIILLEKDLMVLEEGVIEGRKTFGNIIKYIKMTASSNFGNMFSVLVASAFLPFLPMLPIQILVLNLLYDISQISIPWDNMDIEYLKKPRKWDASGISRFMIWIGPTSSVFDITTYLLMWFVFGCNTASNPGLVALFNAGWFVESLMSQTLVVHLIRTKKIPFIQSRAATPVLLMTTAIIAVGVAIPFTQFGGYLKMATLPFAYFPWLALTIVCYMMLCQTLKMLYIKRYNTFL